MTQTAQPDGPAVLANPPAPAGRRRIRRLFRVTQWTINLAVLAGLVLTYTPADVWLGNLLVQDDPLVKADYIIVLGGSPERVVEAAKLYQDGWADKVIVSHQGIGADEMVRLAVAYGVSPTDIIRDGQAGRTHDHPRTVAAAGGFDPASTRVLIVTDAVHTSRARASFLHDGYADVHMHALPWQMTSYRFPDQPRRLRMTTLSALAHEFAGWAFYKVRGWV